MKSLGELFVGMLDIFFEIFLDKVIEKIDSKYEAMRLTRTLKRNEIKTVKMSEARSDANSRVIRFSINETGYGLIIVRKGQSWEPFCLQHTHGGDICVFCKDGVDGVICIDMSSNKRGLQALYKRILTHPQFRLKALLILNRTGK